MKTLLPSFVSFLCILFLFSACQKEFSFDNSNTIGTATGSAVFTYEGGAGNCTSPVISGIFQAGLPLDISNNISVQVNVTDTGSYFITSTSANGIKFSAAGIFTSTGSQVIILAASGTPVAGGSVNFKLGNAGCAFIIVCSASAPVSNNNCKACSYAPLCVGSKLSYYDTLYGTGSIKITDLLSSSDTTIDAKIYQKITSTNGVGYYNCTNGETKAIAYQIISINGNTLQKVQLTMIKANAAMGTTWSDTIINPLGQLVIQNFKIEAKGISKTFGSLNFTNIIFVSLETGIDIPPFGYTATTLSKYYYANGVGLVETQSIDPNTGLAFYHSVIKSYFIP